MYEKAFLEAMADRHGYPLYLYDEKTIRRSIDAVKDAFEGFRILYSAKANPFADIIRLMRQNGVGVDAASVNEVLLAADSGMDAADIYYSSPGKTADDIEKALHTCTIIADSLTEIELIDRIAGQKSLNLPIGVRLNIANEAITASQYEIMSGRASKFGVDFNQFVGHIDRIKELKNVEITGVHVYFGSQLLDEHVVAGNFGIIAESCVRLMEHFDIRFVNFGGGFGVPYTTDETPIDLHAVNKLIREHEAVRTLLQKAVCNIELGRYLVAESGLFVTRVADIKESFGKTYVILRGGMNTFFRPVFTGQYHDIIPFSSHDETETVTVVGNMCTPIDQYYEDLAIKKLEIGDMVAFVNAGAYGYSMSLLDFISFDRPAQILITQDER